MMKRLYFLLFLIFLSTFQVTAQRLGLRKNSWRIGVMGSLDYSYRFIGYKSGEDAARLLIDQRKSETGLMGYSFGVNVSKSFIDDLLRVNIGATYATRSFENTSNLTSIQLDSTILQARVHCLFNYQFIQVPIRLDFYVLNKTRWGLYIPIGISPAIMIGTKVIEASNFSDGTSTNLNKGDEAYDYNHINLSANIGLGFDFHLSKSLVVWAQPQFEYYVINLTRNDFYREKLYAISLNAGISIKLNDKGLYRK